MKSILLVLAVFSIVIITLVCDLFECCEQVLDIHIGISVFLLLDEPWCGWSSSTAVLPMLPASRVIHIFVLYL